ncbi:MAG: hypothetical protein OEM49_04405 [Myxococcales bacterium]|nr:hypothetical protein [Myxococcales bacterium]
MLLELCIYAVVIVVNIAVGGRLLWKGRSNGARPELLLGAALVLDGVEWVFWLLAMNGPLADTPAADLLGAACRVGIIAHNVCLLLFTRLVFRPQSRAVLGAILGLAAVMISSFVIGVALGDWLGYRSDRVWIWLETVPQLLAYVWTSLESTRHYGRLRKRVVHGLADPVVANRLLLWALYGVTMFATEFVYLVSIGVATYAGEYPFLLDGIMIGFTSLSGVMIWMAFYPPRAYKRWISAGTEVRFG